ncbi:MAG TPA: hypothetical protein VHC86_14020 [Opitutaceae bacterium]|nr:hypothetical protein [Opitutaceae bacterium]
MYLLTYLILSLLVAYIGKDRKFGFWGYFFCAFILTPIIGLVVVLASDKKPAVAA